MPNALLTAGPQRRGMGGCVAAVPRLVATVRGIRQCVLLRTACPQRSFLRFQRAQVCAEVVLIWRFQRAQVCVDVTLTSRGKSLPELVIKGLGCHPTEYTRPSQHVGGQCAQTRKRLRE